MENIKINIKDTTESIQYLNIDSIEEIDGNYLLNLNDNISEITVNQLVYYIRRIQNTNGIYDTIIDNARIVSIIDKNKIIITPPLNKIYSIDTIIKNGDNIRVHLNTQHNIFQQDLEECSTNEVYLYDENYNILKTYVNGDFNIPMIYEDKIVTEDDCYKEMMTLNGCGNICNNNNLKVYNYYFHSINASRNDILIRDNDNQIINTAKYISFKYTPFLYADDEIKLYSDIWSKNVIDKNTSCYVYNVTDDYSVKIALSNAYYRLGINFENQNDDLNLGSEDNFNSNFIEGIEESLIPEFIDMERIKYIPHSKDITNNNDKKYIVWNTVRGNEACNDFKTIYTEVIPTTEGIIDINNTKIYHIDNGIFTEAIDNNIRYYKFGYESSPFFNNGIMPTIYKIYKPINGITDSCKYYLTNEIIDKSQNLITGITFYLHFIKRKEIESSERHLNSIYTSGNVYYDSWHIDNDKKETTWWNGYNYEGNIFDLTSFNEFISNSGETSDLIGYLNFTDKDIFNRKKKVSQSFLRLSFYSSKDPIEQKLLYYSTIFLDENELYGKYIKQLNNIYKKGIIKGKKDEMDLNTLVVFYSGDEVDKDRRVDTKISITNEYDRKKSSEGFNIYLFAEDKTFEAENCEKTIYMKVEFNHAGNGKTIPLILWPKNENGDFIPLTTENYIDSLFIEVKTSYVNGQYTYSIPRANEDMNNLKLVLFEPKLDMLKDE